MFGDKQHKLGRTPQAGRRTTPAFPTGEHMEAPLRTAKWLLEAAHSAQFRVAVSKNMSRRRKWKLRVSSCPFCSSVREVHNDQPLLHLPRHPRRMRQSCSVQNYVSESVSHTLFPDSQVIRCRACVSSRVILVKPKTQPLDSSPSNHLAVIDTESGRRTRHGDGVVRGHLPQAFSHGLVRCDTASNNHRLRRRFKFQRPAQRPAHRATSTLTEMRNSHRLESSGHICSQGSVVFLGKFTRSRRALLDVPFVRRPHGSLQAREGEVAAIYETWVPRPGERSRKRVRCWVSLPRQFLQVWTARNLRDTQESSRLVEGLTNGIVNRAPQNRVAADNLS